MADLKRRRECHGHFLKAVDAVGADIHRLTAHLNIAEVAKKLLEEHACLKARQVGAETQVNPVPESEMWVWIALQVEAHGIVEHGLVEICRAVEHHHPVALPHALARDLGVAYGRT